MQTFCHPERSGAAWAQSKDLQFPAGSRAELMNRCEGGITDLASVGGSGEAPRCNTLPRFLPVAEFGLSLRHQSLPLRQHLSVPCRRRNHLAAMTEVIPDGFHRLEFFRDSHFIQRQRGGHGLDSSAAGKKCRFPHDALQSQSAGSRLLVPAGTPLRAVPQAGQAISFHSVPLFTPRLRTAPRYAPALPNEEPRTKNQEHLPPTTRSHSLQTSPTIPTHAPG